jgi:hypothetical protein
VKHILYNPNGFGITTTIIGRTSLCYTNNKSTDKTTDQEVDQEYTLQIVIYFILFSMILIVFQITQKFKKMNRII